MCGNYLTVKKSRLFACFGIILFMIFYSCKIHNTNQHIGEAPSFPFTGEPISKHKNLIFDNNGIPLLQHKDSLIYYPIQYTRVSLDYYANYIRERTPERKAAFLKLAEYIRDNITRKDGFGVWECNTEIKPYKTGVPWPSAMSQGFGIGVMLQAYSVTKNQSYLSTANLALNSYEILLKNGGIKNIWDGQVHFEEYADPESHVLNGYIYSLVGLFYHYKLTGSRKALKLFQEGAEALSIKLKDYDAGFTTFYSSLRYEGNYSYDSAKGPFNRPDHYHELVVRQLITLYLWTTDKIFYEYAYKFYQQDLGMFSEFCIPNKIAGIDVTSSIAPKTHGKNNLMNALWTFGSYWSTNKFPTELILDFGQHRTDITKLVLYGFAKEEFLPNFFEIHILNKGKWILANTEKDILRTHNTKFITGQHTTVVREYDLFGNFEGDKLKIKFISSPNNMIALRNINVFFNRREEFENIVEKIEQNMVLE